MAPAPLLPLDPPAGAPPAARSRAIARQWSGGPVRIFDLDPALLDGLDPDAATAARAAGLAPSLVVDCGRWQVPGAAARDRALGLLVLGGVLTRCVEVDGTACPELLGEGDVLRPWADGGRDRPVHWRVLERTTFAVLDRRFLELLRRWPELVGTLLSRTVQRSEWMAVQMTIPQLRRADARLRLLFEHLAGRWGRVTPAGIVLALPLSNQLISEIVCLRRPTVSTTMTRMAQDGEIVREPGGRFLLNLRQVEPGAGSPCSAAA